MSDRGTTKSAHQTGSVTTDRFVARLNIEHFKQRLAEESDPAEVALLQRLLAEEEAKLAMLSVTARNRRR